MSQLAVGIVGLPNVGKSTLFNSILKREQALSANYPFATIDPNIGIVDVPDSRLEDLQQAVLKETGKLPPIVRSTIEFVDIAGLVKGASKGEGLGNQFLSTIREVDMIIQVVRDFSDENIIREHSKNPNDDTDVINSELLIKDLETIEKKIKTVSKGTAAHKEAGIMEQVRQLVSSGKFAYDIRALLDEKNYKEFIRPLYLLTDKEMVYVFNVDETDERLKESTFAEYKGHLATYINAKLESELSSLSAEDQQSYLAELGIPISGLDKVIKICYQKLGLISFLTAGEKEVRAWEIHRGMTAQQAAGRIHGDFEKNFIKAEVIKFADYIAVGSRPAARDAGKLRLEGKEYIVQDGDVIEFKIGST